MAGSAGRSVVQLLSVVQPWIFILEDWACGTPPLLGGSHLKSFFLFLKWAGGEQDHCEHELVHFQGVPQIGYL